MKNGTGRCLYAAGLLLSFWMTGCGNAAPEQTEPYEDNVSQSEQPQDWIEACDREAEEIGELCRDIYEEAAASGTVASLEMVRQMVDRYGEAGYVAVDSENQVDMAGADQVMEFNAHVERGEEAELTILAVSYLGGFTKYDCRTIDGKVDVIRGYYEYAEGKLKSRSVVSYPADFWEYTREGYLIFQGSCFTEAYYVLALSGTPLHTALRVEPLREECRELNRKYIRPVGYARNNLFLADWDEGDFGEVDFYDLYDIFYGIRYNRTSPYVADERPAAGAVYRIPGEEFEDVIMAYFKLDSGALREKTKYFLEDDSYEYKPRGFYEAEYPEVPYPEVVDYRVNEDGTIALTVNAVYPYRNLSKAYTHETVVRPLEDGGVQYVSNKILSPAEENVMDWHVPRLTEADWEEVYGESE